MMIYSIFLDPMIRTNDRFKLSRAEEKWPNVSWKTVWRNFSMLQCVPPVVKERAWFIRLDMLPGLRSRAFKHRNIVDPRDKMCPILIAGHPCDNEESLIHFFCECPGTQAVWNELKDFVLTYTDNNNKYPPVTDLQFLLLDFSSSSKKIRTSVWLVSTFLSRLYEEKLAKNELTFVKIWVMTMTDLKIATKCSTGYMLDDSITEA